MNSNSNVPPSRFRRVIKWIFAAPAVIILVVMLGIGARYISGKARLDRIEAARGSWARNITFRTEPVVPTWIRKAIGEKQCLPLDWVKGLAIASANDDDLIQSCGCLDAEWVQVGSELARDDGGEDQCATDRGLSQLGDNQTVQTLELYGGRYSGEGLGALASCPNLINLGIFQTNLSDDWCRGVRKLSRLKRLDVVVKKELTGRDTSELATHPELFRFRINPRYSPAIESFGERPLVIMWHFGVERLTRDIVEPLTKIKALDTLVMEFNTLDDDAFLPLARISSLRELQICGFGITDSHLRDLKGCSKLEMLSIANHDTGASHGLQNLTGLASLTQLVLHYEVFPTSDVEAVSRLTQLRALRISLLSRSEVVGLDRLRSLANLEELDLQYVDGFDGALSVIQSMPRLHWLRYETIPRSPHPLQSLADRSRLPVGLATNLSEALRAVQREAEADVEPETVSLGLRQQLPKDRLPQPQF